MFVIRLPKLARQLQTNDMLLWYADGYTGMRAIIWFFRRYAFPWSLFAGLVAHNVLLPTHSPWWQELIVTLVVGIPLYLLLYKDGVTANRPKRNRDSPFR
jgi:hypothetical protein